MVSGSDKWRISVKKASFYVQNWMSGVDTDKLKRSIGEKKVYVLDYDKDYEFIREFLEEKGIVVYGFITIDELENIEEKPYLIVRYAEDKILSRLIRYGYCGYNQMHIICRDVTITDIYGYYSDECGNEIICEDRFEGIEVEFQGYNNKLYIGKDFYADGVSIKLKGGASLEFGEGMAMQNGRMYLKNSKTKFAGDGWLGSDFFISNFDGTLTVGKGITCLNGFYMCCVENTELSIGEDCMFAKNVKILSGGAHSLFDLTEKVNLNIGEDIHVRIGNHVWVGMDSSVIYNTDIGEHSMVGAMSLVKGIYPGHVVIAGNKARVIRKNIDWDYRDYLTYPEYEEMMREREKAKKNK